MVRRFTLTAVIIVAMVMGAGAVCAQSASPGQSALPARAQAKSLDRDSQKPVRSSVDINGKVFINNAEVDLNDLVPKLKAITGARGGMEERIFMRADKRTDYGTVAKVMGLLSDAGFKRLALETEVEQGSAAH